MVERISILDENFGRFVDKLPSGRREIVESVASAVIWRILNRVSSYMNMAIKMLAEKGILIDLDLNIDRTRRGAVAVMRVELNDVDPGLLLKNRKFIVRSISDQWLRWALIKILVEIAEEEIDETMLESLGKDLGLSPKIEDFVVVGRIPLEEDENSTEKSDVDMG